MGALDAFEPRDRISAHNDLIEHALIGGVFLGDFDCNFFIFVKAMQVVFKEHGMGHGLLHADADMVGVALADTIIDGLHIIEEEFECGDTPPPYFRDKSLADHTLQTITQLKLDEVTFNGIEEADNTVDDFTGGVGVQRTDHEVTCCGSTDCSADGVGVAHFTDEDYIRVMA